MRWLAVGVGCGCSAEPAAPGGRGPSPEDEVLLEVGAVLQTAVADVFAVDGLALERTYADAMANGDAACPYDYGDFWYSNCETSSGLSFDGYVFEYAEVDPEGYAGEYWALYGEATIGRPDAEALAIGGFAGWGDLDDGSGRYLYHYAYGTFLAPGDASWLGRDGSVSLYVQAGTLHEGGRSLYVDGEVGAVGGVPGRAVQWDEVWLTDEVWPQDEGCTGAPIGTAHVRTAEGDWFDLAFDACDGCASVSGIDGALGTLCADFSSWLAWEVSPW